MVEQFLCLPIEKHYNIMAVIQNPDIVCLVFIADINAS